MTLYPHIQAKAQEELDNVIGSDRLPKLSDREELPYINALVKEVFRWNPVLPLGELDWPTRDHRFSLERSP